MNSVLIACVIAATIFAGGVAGLALKQKLPEKFTTDRPRDMMSEPYGGLFRVSSAPMEQVLMQMNTHQ
jgi:hypothetical protein